jgi:hypothetical protein
MNIGNVTNNGLPIMEDIATEWSKFKQKFYEIGGNIYKAEIFNNMELGNNGGDVGYSIFTRNRYETLREDLLGIRLEDICGDDGTTKGKAEVEGVLGIELNWVEYFRLRTEVVRITDKFYSIEDGDRMRMSIDEFVTGRRKGCKRYRVIMTGKWSKEYIENNPCVIPAGITLWGEGMGGMTRKLVESNYELWTISVLHYDYKNFLFKLVQGKLYLNNQSSSSSQTFYSVLHIKKYFTVQYLRYDNTD